MQLYCQELPKDILRLPDDDGILDVIVTYDG